MYNLLLISITAYSITTRYYSNLSLNTTDPKTTGLVTNIDPSSEMKNSVPFLQAQIENINERILLLKIAYQDLFDRYNNLTITCTCNTTPTELPTDNTTTTRLSIDDTTTNRLSTDDTTTSRLSTEDTTTTRLPSDTTTRLPSDTTTTRSSTEDMTTRFTTESDNNCPPTTEPINNGSTGSPECGEDELGSLE